MTPFSTLCFGTATILSGANAVLNYKHYGRINADVGFSAIATCIWGVMTVIGILTLV